jgi:hypothetical protein
MASQMYKVASQTNVFVSLRPKEQVIRLTNGMKGIKKGSYVIHLKLMWYTILRSDNKRNNRSTTQKAKGKIRWGKCEYLLGPVLVVSHVFLEELQSNAKFAITVEPENKRLKSRFEQVKELRQKGLATVLIQLTTSFPLPVIGVVQSVV